MLNEMCWAVRAYYINAINAKRTELYGQSINSSVLQFWILMEIMILKRSASEHLLHPNEINDLTLSYSDGKGAHTHGTMRENE